MSARTLQRVARVLLVAAPFALAAAAWVLLGWREAVPYWQLDGDYSWYALSHAFTIESKLAGSWAVNIGYNVHPGVPFGIASWVALRLATWGATGFEDRVLQAVAHAEAFWTWAKVMSLALTFSGLWVVSRMFRGDPRTGFVAGMAFLVALPAVYRMGLLQLSNESFALAYVAGFHLLAWRLIGPAGAPSAHFDSPIWRGRSRRDLTSAAIGAWTVIGWSIKIYYLAPAIGLCVAVAVIAMMGALPRDIVARSARQAAAGAAACAAVIVFAFVGFDAFRNWLIWNWQMLTHTERYGTGQGGFLRLGASYDALVDLGSSSSGVFPAVVGGSILLFLAVAFRCRRDADWKRAYGPFALAVLIGFCINVVGVLKHYSPSSRHYMIPAIAALPALLLVVRTTSFGRKGLNVLTAAIVLALPVTIGIVEREHRAQIIDAQAILRDVAKIEALPIREGEKRVWGYFSAARPGVVPLVSSYAGSGPVAQAIAQQSRVDIAPTPRADGASWRYVIFPKPYYPTRQSIYVNYKAMFDFAATKFVPRAEDRVIEMERFFVLEPVRSPGSGRAGDQIPQASISTMRE